MSITIVEAGPSVLFEYGVVPSVVTVHEVFDVVGAPEEPGGVRLLARTLQTPYIKNYDAPPAAAPSLWSDLFDMRHWRFFTALLGAHAVGRATIAWKTTDLDLFDGRDDVAVLWDLRVHPAHQRLGIGTRLFAAAAQWARAQGASMLKGETQSINVPACRFYQAQGCQLCAVQHGAYPDLPDEVQLLWYRHLAWKDATASRIRMSSR